MKKLERIACLYLTFLNTGGLSFARIRQLLPLAYQGEHDSARRKFERDKEELRGLGMDLKHYAPGDMLPNGRRATDHVYAPADELHRLPELNLSGSQHRALAMLLMRALTEQSGRTIAANEYALLESAAAKLMYKNPGLIEQLGSSNERRARFRTIANADLEEKLSVIHEAMRQSRWVTINYVARTGKKEKRRVAGRGLISHKGRWCFVAYCDRAEDVRSFYVDRMDEASLEERRYEPDHNFDIRNYSLHPLGLHKHPPRKILIKLEDDREDAFFDFMQGAPFSAEETAQSVLELKTSNVDALFSWLVRHPGSVKQLGPAEVQGEFVQYVERMKDLHAPEVTA